jgi:hypothetical protein
MGLSSTSRVNLLGKTSVTKQSSFSDTPNGDSKPKNDETPLIKVIKEESLKEKSTDNSTKSFIFKNRTGTKSFQIEPKADLSDFVSSERTINMNVDARKKKKMDIKSSDNKDDRLGRRV